MNIEPYQIAALACVILVILEMFHAAFIWLGFGVGMFSVAILQYFRGTYEATWDVIIFTLSSAAAIFIFRKYFRHKSDEKFTDKDVNQY